MSKKNKTAIEPTRQENFPEWYQKVVRVADLAENSEVRGCMVIKPWGYGIWENIKNSLDKLFKDTGHENAYFPLLIPLSYLEQEAKHAEGFATECAVVTHHRLEAEKVNGETKLKPTGELSEPFVIRPTSETIIGSAFSRWVQSYRDLPLLINQWANVMRWEMRPRLFLRTSEFLWQEGHTVHETAEEALEETLKMLDVYEDFLENYLAIPVIKGVKSEREKFPGAVDTYTVEAMVQDHKAIQAGTSHFLGQNFAKSSDIVFQTRDGKKEFAWTTSWGVSTRLIGTVIMTHGDDNGVIIPPRVAPAQVVILPFLKGGDVDDEVIEACQGLKDLLVRKEFFEEKVRVKLDTRDIGSGIKKWDWIKRGAPIIVEIGPRDLENNSLVMYRRDRPANEKKVMDIETFLNSLEEILDSIQSGLLKKASELLESNSKKITDKDEFYKFFSNKSEKNGKNESGFAFVPWAGDDEDEEKLQNDLKITIRCLLDTNDNNMSDLAEKNCFYTDKPAKKIAVFARSY